MKKYLSILLAFLLTIGLSKTAPSAECLASDAGAPAIRGPQFMTLTVGYGSVSTDVFTITGDPDPTVRISYGLSNPGSAFLQPIGMNKIRWNSATKRIDIESGLSEGAYVVVLTASNGRSQDAISIFQLTIAVEGAPEVTFPGSFNHFPLSNRVNASILLPFGYSATSTEILTITGDPTPTVTRISGDDRITWNGSTNQFDIAEGLSEGIHSVEIKISNGRYPDLTFRLTVVVTIAPAEAFSEDVKPSDWYYDAVNYVSDKGLMAGFAPNVFKPDETLTRAMIVAILHRLDNEPGVTGLRNTFVDVPDDKWYTNVVLWATDNGIIKGYGDNRFGPMDSVTKEQLAVLIYRVQQSRDKIPPDLDITTDWPDSDEISGWAKDAVATLTRQGVFSDIPGENFEPQAPATRAMVASMLHRYLTAIERIENNNSLN